MDYIFYISIFDILVKILEKIKSCQKWATGQIPLGYDLVNKVILELIYILICGLWAVIVMEILLFIKTK